MGGKKRKKPERVHTKPGAISGRIGSDGKTKRHFTLSACMIVKDEERLLSRCLESTIWFVDEIIVVDTGSTDGTVEIAQRYGAKVYHHQWEGNFSKHRNQSISYAKGEWIFILDADEEVVHWDETMDALMENEGLDSIHVKVENIFAKGEGSAWHNSIRLFRNNGTIRYEGRVHNEVVGYRDTAPSSVVIYHRGYSLDSSREEKKYLRTTALLQEEIAKDPKNPKWHHYLGVAYSGKQLYGKALAECRKALSLAQPSGEPEDLSLWTRFVGALCCLNTKRLVEAERLCLEAIEHNPRHVDSYYLLSSLSYHQGETERFMDYSETYLSLLERLKRNPHEFGLLVHNTIMHEWRIRLHRAFVFVQHGKRREAATEYSQSLKACNDKGEYYRQRCLFHMSRSEYGSAQQLLGKALKHAPERKELQEVKAQLTERMVGDVAEGKTAVQGDAGHKNTMGATISLCMMVKDEEHFLPKCLESVKDYVDEIIIVDTGSTDNTVRIAESYGAKVYFHQWEGDFSKHRNQSIGYATGDWVFILDADEVVAPGCAKMIREATKEQLIDNVNVVVKSAFDRGKGEAVHNSVRLFRNNGTIRYEGRVHNRLIGHGPSKVYPVTIYHEGYNLPPEQSRNKIARTAALLRKEIEQDPEHPRAYHHLAACCISEHRYGEAIDWAQKAVALAESSNDPDPLYLWSHFILGLSYLKTARVDDAEHTCLMALEKNHDHLDSHYLLCITCFHKREWKKLLYHSDEYLALLEKIDLNPDEFGPMVHNTANNQWRVHLHRGFAFKGLNEKERAKEAFSLARQMSDDTAECYKLSAVYCMDLSEFREAEQYVLAAIRHNPDDAELYRRGAQIYQELGQRAEEKAFFKEALQRDLDDIEAAFRLGTICLEEGDFSTAKDLLERVTAKDQGHSGALINLGIVARRSGASDKAAHYLERACTLVPDSVEALSNLAYLYYEKGDLPRARQVFERLAELDPTLPDIHLMLSLIYIHLNTPELAVAECDELMALLGLDRNMTLNSVSDLSNLFADIGDVLVQQGRPKLAALAFDNAIHLGDGTTQAPKKIAMMCFRRKNYPLCLEYVERAIRLDPHDPMSFSLMGDCYQGMGAAEAARLCRERAKRQHTWPASQRQSLSD